MCRDKRNLGYLKSNCNRADFFLSTPSITDYSPGATGAAALPIICPASKTLSPILLVSLTPMKWRYAIQAVVGGVDEICP